jgi:hypothetical protein
MESTQSKKLKEVLVGMQSLQVAAALAGELHIAPRAVFTAEPAGLF